MLTELEGGKLEAWLADVEASGLPQLKTFANGIRHDRDAVINGLTLEHNSGAVEGVMDRLKVYKQQMYGRADFDLLRKRVLLSS
ncbi:transposase [Catenulispora sp. NL8]|uniref:Transposase n=1 Tax=Catenulispora pinistramenti TaxID=2705254 RepID=A0ABS5KLK7_9ACTN|nr:MULTISPECIES: transposase [Catenulispora]MBS2546933.1 transposase [Catenulispora pinistramenti]